MMTPDELAARYFLARILWWRHDLEKLDAAAVNALLKSLARANVNIRDKIEKELPALLPDMRKGAALHMWLNEITAPMESQVVDTITDAWTVSAIESLNAYNDILSFDGKAQNIMPVPATPESVKALASTSHFSGKSLAALVSAVFYDGIAAEMVQCVNTGMNNGWGHKKIVDALLRESIDKGFVVTRNQCITLSRSYIQQASVNAKMAVYQRNSDVVKGVKWTAILDNRVCGKCAALDGQTYGWDEQRPKMIAHPRCRCLWLPWLKSYSDFGIDMDDLEEAARPWILREKGNIDAGGNRKILEAGTTRENFGGWWKTLPYEEQVRSIGPTRAKLINEGKIKWEDLVDRRTGRYRTLGELQNGIKAKQIPVFGAPPKNEAFIEKITGASGDVPDSITKNAKAVNPKFGQGNGYDTNCQRCVPAYELRRRGHNVEAMPNHEEKGSGTSKRLFFVGWECFIDADVKGALNYQPAVHKDRMLEDLKNLQDGARVAIIWTWRRTKISHAITCEKISGQLIFIDPQNGKTGPDVLKNGDKRIGYSYFRMDNLQLKEDFEWTEIIRKKE